MSLEAARRLSIPELLRVLNEKLSRECVTIQEAPLPPTVSTASLESEIANVEARAHDVLRLIRSLRNFLQPVNRLPQEILSLIVQDVPSPSAKDARSIIPLTQVCRHWRASIISTPANWTSISSHSKLLAALSLERARTAPLKVYLRMDHAKQHLGFSDLITTYTRNITALELRQLTTIEDFMQMFPGFPQSTPNLQLLEMSTSVFESSWDPSIDPFSSFHSALKRLTLVHIPLYPSLLNFRTLTEFTLFNYSVTQTLDTFLSILEENPLLERMELCISFVNPSLRVSQRQATPIINRLRYLLLTVWNAGDARALISQILLQKGANLRILSHDEDAVGLNNILSGVSTNHLRNLESPTYMYFRAKRIRLSGPNGNFEFYGLSPSDISFVGLPLLSFDKIRKFHLAYPREWEINTNHIVFNPSPFPALETLVLTHDIRVSRTLSTLFSSPESSPSLKTLAFLDCDFSGNFTEKLQEFASQRKDTRSARLHRILIVHPGGKFPSADSICALRKYVPAVECQLGTELPEDLARDFDVFTTIEA